MDFGLRIETQLVAGTDCPRATSASSAIAKFPFDDDVIGNVVSPSDDVSLLLTAGETTSVVLFLTPDLLHTAFSLGAQFYNCHIFITTIIQAAPTWKTFSNCLEEISATGLPLVDRTRPYEP